MNTSHGVQGGLEFVPSFANGIHDEGVVISKRKRERFGKSESSLIYLSSVR